MANTLPTPSHIAARILVIRGHKVMVDSDLAELYGVSTKRLKEQVRRNAARFPGDFLFALSNQYPAILRSQFATSSWGGRRYATLVFTEHGERLRLQLARLDAATSPADMNLPGWAAITTDQMATKSNPARMHNPPHPGAVLQDTVLSEGRLTVSELARRLKVSRVALSRVVNGRAAVSADMALRLAAALGGSADSWLRMQASYDLWQASRKRRPTVEPLKLAA